MSVSSYWGSAITSEPQFKGHDQNVACADPKKDLPEVLELVVLIARPDKGKIGILNGLYLDGTNCCAVELD